MYVKIGVIPLLGESPALQIRVICRKGLEDRLVGCRRLHVERNSRDDAFVGFALEKR
jgi:hypothetical protein